MTTARRMAQAAAGVGTGGGGTGDWTPADLDNQLAWWDFTNLTGFSDGDSIGTAVDRFGSDDLTQVTAGNQPIYRAAVVNGLDVAEWRDRDEQMSVTLSTSPSLPMAGWALVYLDLASLGGANDDPFVFTTNTFAPALYLEGSTEIWQLASGSVLGGPAIAVGWHFVVWSITSGGSGSLWVDGFEYTGSVGTTAPGGTAWVGSKPDSTDRWSGYVADIGIVNDELTATEQGHLNAFLADKAALTSILNVTSSGTADILVVGGGGGGGGGTGGGGGGGEVNLQTSVSLATGKKFVVVGDGGTGGSGTSGDGTNGGQSSFHGLYTAAGGGGGAANSRTGLNGAAGGGGGGNGGTGGTGSTGGNGGNGAGSPDFGAGGGGGDTGTGSNGTTTAGGAGGAGTLVSEFSGFGDSGSFGGGGGGGEFSTGANAAGGSGGGGQGGHGGDQAGAAGTDGTGGGGGGAGGNSSSPTGDGGSGVVIVRYTLAGSVAASGGTESTDATYKYHLFEI